MANPQKENGYTAIANEIIEHLVSYGLTGGELGMCLWVMRKTYGFSKKADRISLTQFEKALRMTRAGICKIKKSLVNNRILLIQSNLIKINKNWEEWVVNNRIPSKPAYNRVVNSGIHTKETITKETYNKSEKFLEHYMIKFSEYVSKKKKPIHSPATIYPKIQSALDELGEDRLKELLEIYMQSKDKFYEGNLWSLTLFLNPNILTKLHVGNK